MKISRDWLGDYVDLGSLSDEKIAARLTQIGHAVESVEKHGSDTVFDIEFTSNRVDAMSHLGVARELAAAVGRELKPPTPNLGKVLDRGEVTIAIDAPELCTRYTGLVIHGVKVRPSDEKIQRRLEAVGLRPISNLVDATNYVMLALGHPLHAFDLSEVSEKTIRVRRGKSGEKVTTLDGVVRTIDEETCVIADGKRAVALGGVIGGANSEIRETTRDVLLECAHFVPWAIRRTARRLDLRTDASYRFERGVDPGDTVLAAAMTAELIISQAGTRGDLVDVIAVPPKQRVITLRERRLQEASAGMIAIAFTLELFRRLGWSVTQNAEGIQVTVPTWRGDVVEEDDLIEEALRFYGYNSIPAALPRVTTGDVRIDPIAVAEEEIRDLLVGCGVTETVTFSFIHPDHNRLFSDEPQIEITNTLTETTGAMRLSLFPGLLQGVAYNRNYGSRDGAIFEVGRTYHRKGEAVRERHAAAVVLFGMAPGHWADPKKAFDYFDLKGIVEAMARKYHVAVDFSPAALPFLKEGQAGVARHGDIEIGFAGSLSGAVLQKFDIKGEVLAAEVDLSRLLSCVKPWKMQPVSHFPGVPKVLAFLHPPELQYAEIVNTIRSLDIPHLQEVGIWDRFVAEGRDEVKTAVSMWYQALDRSLTQEEVSEIHDRVAAKLASLLPVRIVS